MVNSLIGKYDSRRHFLALNTFSNISKKMGIAAFSFASVLPISDCAITNNTAISKFEAIQNTPAQVEPKQTKPFMVNYERANELPAVVEFADVYLSHYLPANRDKIIVLYPGSYSDLTPLEFGLRVLHGSGIQEVNFTYTEIGDYKGSWANAYDGLNGLKSEIDKGLDSRHC